MEGERGYCSEEGEALSSKGMSKNVENKKIKPHYSAKKSGGTKHHSKEWLFVPARFSTKEWQLDQIGEKILRKALN